MPGSPARTFHYIRSWLTGRDDLVSRELVLDRGGTQVPGTFLAPRGRRGPLPAWIVMHGITRPGREHAQLARFTRALAAGGCAVLLPEVPEWRRLDLAPTTTLPTVLAALRALESLEDVDAGRVGLAGFSFGSPQAIAASAHPDLRGRLAGVVGFGGYCDLERTVLFQLTGRHEWGGGSTGSGRTRTDGGSSPPTTSRRSPGWRTARPSRAGCGGSPLPPGTGA